MSKIKAGQSENNPEDRKGQVSKAVLKHGRAEMAVSLLHELLTAKDNFEAFAPGSEVYIGAKDKQKTVKIDSNRRKIKQHLMRVLAEA